MNLSLILEECFKKLFSWYLQCSSLQNKDQTSKAKVETLTRNAVLAKRCLKTLHLRYTSSCEQFQASEKPASLRGPSASFHSERECGSTSQTFQSGRQQTLPVKIHLGSTAGSLGHMVLSLSLCCTYSSLTMQKSRSAHWLCRTGLVPGLLFTLPQH